MADEITIVSEISLDNGNVDHEFRPDSILVDQASAKFVDKILDIGTSEETISFDDISTKGWCCLQNLDSTNYVNWGFTTGDLHGEMKAGETAGPFRLKSAGALIMQANSADCKVRFIAYEN